MRLRPYPARFPITADISATTRNTIPASTKLPVKKYANMAAKAAMGNANRKPIAITAIKAIARKTITSHQNEVSDRETG